MSLNVFEALTGALSSVETADEAATDGDRPPRKLRSRGERITELLAECGGYTWQGEIVEALSCSESTTSRELSKLEGDGRITRYRIGKRNVVCLPEREPECFQRERPGGDRLIVTDGRE